MNKDHNRLLLVTGVCWCKDVQVKTILVWWKILWIDYVLCAHQVQWILHQLNAEWRIRCGLKCSIPIVNRLGLFETQITDRWLGIRNTDKLVDRTTGDGSCCTGYRTVERLNGLCLSQVRGRAQQSGKQKQETHSLCLLFLQRMTDKISFVTCFLLFSKSYEISMILRSHFPVAFIY